MDDKNIQQKDEEMSLDDMMAASVPQDDSENSEENQIPTPTDEEQSDNMSENAEEVDKSSDETPETSEEIKEDSSDEAENTDVSEAADEAVDDMKDEEETTAEEKPQQSMPAPKEYKGKWYIVHTYSGHENKVAKTLMQRVQAMGFENNIFDALVPTRDTIRVRGGKKETIKEKIFPGYILVNMELSDEAWVLVRTTPGVTSFVGAQNKPTPIRDDEVQAIVAFVGQKDPVYKAQFSTGEAVKITDGPFSDFLGTVESIDEAKGKIKVLVSIFGRETPVELDFLQVAKI